MMQEEVLEKASRRYGQAETYWVESTSRTVGFEANRLKEVQRRDARGIALRVISEGRVGSTSTTDLSRVEELVNRSGSLAEFGPESVFEFTAGEPLSTVSTYDSNLETLGQREMIDTAQNLITRLREIWPNVLCDARVSCSFSTIDIRNSAGMHREMRGSSYAVVLSAQMIRETDMLHVWSGHVSSGYFDETDLERIVFHPVNEAIRYSQNTLSAPKPGTPVVFTPRGFAAALAEPIIAGVNGRNVAEGSSPLASKWGEKIFDESITIHDNPLMPMNAEARPFDDEGTSCRKTTIVSDGVAASPLTDMHSAKQMGRTSTGSARRGLSGAPSPDASALDVSAGSADLSAFMHGPGPVLIVEDLLGAGQSNVLGGEYRGNVSLGYLAEGGEIIGRVKDTMIAGNVYKTLCNVEAVSAKREWVFGSLLAPYIRCDSDIEVSGGG